MYWTRTSQNSLSHTQDRPSLFAKIKPTILLLRHIRVWIVWLLRDILCVHSTFRYVKVFGNLPGARDTTLQASLTITVAYFILRSMYSSYSCQGHGYCHTVYGMEMASSQCSNKALRMFLRDSDSSYTSACNSTRRDYQVRRTKKKGLVFYGT